MVSVSSGHGEPVAGGQVTFTANPVNGASATVGGSPSTISSAGVASATAAANSTPGSYTVTANAGSAANAVFHLTNILPGLTGISPASGSTAGGNHVTLTGMGFGTAATTQVLLHGTALPAASIVSVSGTQIVYVAPQHAAGTVSVTVSVNGSALSGSMTYQYAAPIIPPGLTGTSPASGGVAGGNQVTLTGTGFGTKANTQVLLDGSTLPATSLVSVSGTEIVYVAPAHAAGNVAVTVKVNGTLLAGSGTYTYGSVSPQPGTKPPGGTGGSPTVLPGSRPTGTTGQIDAPNPMAPSPLPLARP